MITFLIPRSYICFHWILWVAFTKLSISAFFFDKISWLPMTVIAYVSSNAHQLQFWYFLENVSTCNVPEVWLSMDSIPCTRRPRTIMVVIFCFSWREKTNAFVQNVCYTSVRAQQQGSNNVRRCDVDASVALSGLLLVRNQQNTVKAAARASGFI